MAEIRGDDIRKDLFDLRDEEYAEFHRKLVPGEEKIIGIRVPVLRNYAKGLYRSEKENLDEVFGCLKNEYYEEIMLRGMLIGLCKNPDREKFFSMIEEFVPQIRNWGICDVFCGGLKEVKKYKKETYDFLKKYLSSEREFDVRFALVMLTGYYIDEEYIDRVLEISKNIKHEGYYAKMANAWLLSICFVKFYDKTVEFIKGAGLDIFTHNKAIQKARESRRIDPQRKEELLKMKKKDGC